VSAGGAGILGRAEIGSLIPHAGAMVLLDAVLRWDATSIACRTARHRDPDNPLRRGGRLGAVAGVELAAQAMAAHGRLAGSIAEQPRGGYIASLREVVCRSERLDDVADDLLVEAERLMGDDARVLYAFRVSAAGAVLVSGRAAVVLAASGGDAQR
jgi:predicted hotdog family 3-hydroxylacyl-ACP dehydratase